MATTTATPVHLRSDSCFVCGSPATVKGRPECPHNWTNAEALAEARAADRRTTVRYSNGTTTPEANYVATVRPY